MATELYLDKLNPINPRTCSQPITVLKKIIVLYRLRGIDRFGFDCFDPVEKEQV